MMRLCPREEEQQHPITFDFDIVFQFSSHTHVYTSVHKTFTFHRITPDKAKAYVLSSPSSHRRLFDANGK